MLLHPNPIQIREGGDEWREIPVCDANAPPDCCNRLQIKAVRSGRNISCCAGLNGVRSTDLKLYMLLHPNPIQIREGGDEWREIPVCANAH